MNLAADAHALYNAGNGGTENGVLAFNFGRGSFLPRNVIPRGDRRENLFPLNSRNLKTIVKTRLCVGQNPLYNNFTTFVVFSASINP